MIKETFRINEEVRLISTVLAQMQERNIPARYAGYVCGWGRVANVTSVSSETRE